MPDLSMYFNVSTLTYENMPYEVALELLDTCSLIPEYGCSRDIPKDIMRMASKRGIGVMRNAYDLMWVTPCNARRTRFSVRVDNKYTDLPY